MNNSRLTIAQYLDGLASRDRVILSKAITLVESNLPNDQIIAGQLVEQIIHRAGNSIRIGITGVPGVGKSTFIEAFGNTLTKEGKKVAVLTIDPSSQLTKGSILGDKTRMQSLSKNPNVYIRPTASGNVLGGTGGKTREAILICEAAGFDVIIIETVGVGQSEVNVRNMVDFFLLLMLAGAGDELQGIKKGIMEMADAIVITKADEDNIQNARRAQSDYQHALHLFPAKVSGWTPIVTTSSALTHQGIDEVWKIIQKFQSKTNESAFFERQRHEQNVQWFNDYFHQLLLQDFQRHENLQQTLQQLSGAVKDESISPYGAAQRLLQAYHNAIKKS
ncbi:MAG TPA: methylmalonyl Co-A mutase-associated GTPase MeaB [Chryseosolibacter sp.]